MEKPAPRVRALNATLMPDCSIELEVSMPGWDEPQRTVIEQSADFLNRVGDKPRPIDLEGWDSTDLLAQAQIAKHLGRIERELARGDV